MALYMKSALIITALGIAMVPGYSEVPGECDVTPTVHATAPTDPNAGSVGSAEWYMNPERTIWAGPVPANGWRVGAEKTYWVRPQGAELQISGHLVGLPESVLEAVIPCCYPTGFQIVGLKFPSAGCWKVRATAGDQQLQFVTLVSAPEGQ